MYAQKASELTAQEACICIGEKLPQAEPDSYNNTLKKCIADASIKHQEDLYKEHKIKSTTVENIMFLQNEIVEILKKECDMIKELTK